MDAEDHGRRRIAQHAFFDHLFRAARLAQRRAFLGGLEDQFQRAGQFVTARRQHFGHAQGHGHVRVMAAGVHHADFLAAGTEVAALVRDADSGGVGQTGLLGQWQGVQLGANRHHRARLAAAQDTDHAGVGDAGLYLQAQLPQAFGDAFGGLHLAIAQFGVLVDLVAQFDHPRQRLGDAGVEVAPVRRLRGAGRPRKDSEKQGEQCLAKRRHGGFPWLSK